MNNKALTLTIVANLTSNYGESLGNIASIQKVYKSGKTYAIRSKESLKNAIMVQSGLYDDLLVATDGVAQKEVSEEINTSNCRALEGGYMNTSGITKIRKSSFYLTDAIAFEPFINDVRFHNNLYLAQTMAKQQGINLQEKSKEAGLMPYQYEFDKSFKKYSITIDLDRVGVDENYGQVAEIDERIFRVHQLLESIKNLSLVVKGNLDNAEPIFVVGGIGNRKTHYFDNVVNVINDELIITKDLKNKLAEGYSSALLEGENFKNENEVKGELNSESIGNFFDKLKAQVKTYYENAEN